jgi:hypothetical protein
MGGSLIGWAPLLVALASTARIPMLFPPRARRSAYRTEGGDDDPRHLAKRFPSIALPQRQREHGHMGCSHGSGWDCKVVEIRSFSTPR